jgi:hypothetical protein
MAWRGKASKSGFAVPVPAGERAIRGHVTNPEKAFRFPPGGPAPFGIFEDPKRLEIEAIRERGTVFSRTRWTLTSDPKPARLPRARGPRAEGGKDGSRCPEPISGLRPKEESLAAYLLARAALHRKIEGPALEYLRAGHASVQEVGELFPLGRSNVREDIRKTTGEETPLRTIASYDLHNALLAKQWYPPGTAVPDDDIHQTAAASSQYARTGVCYSFATNTTAVHAAKLDRLQAKRAIVAQSKSSTVDHVWSEMLPGGLGEDGKPLLHGEDIIMDGWCQENLAVLREDSRFAGLDEDGNGGHLSHAHVLDRESGPKALGKVGMFRAQIEESRALQHIFWSRFDHLVAVGAELEERCLWDAQSVFREAFRHQAVEALEKDAGKPAPGMYGFIPGVDPVAQRAKQAAVAEIQAVGVARSLGANIRGAIAEAPQIIASAREMFPRPESGRGWLLSRISAFFPA